MLGAPQKNNALKRALFVRDRVDQQFAMQTRAVPVPEFVVV